MKIPSHLRRDFYPSEMIIWILINRSPPKLAVRLDVQSNPLLPPTPIFSLNRYPTPPVRGITILRLGAGNIDPPLRVGSEEEEFST